MVALCSTCNTERAALRRPKTREQVRQAAAPARPLREPQPPNAAPHPARCPPARCRRRAGAPLLPLALGAPVAAAAASRATHSAPHPTPKPHPRQSPPARPARPTQNPNPQLCRPCFFRALEDEVHATITACGLFARGERVAVAASGGKDSTVLAHMLTLLNARHEWVSGLYGVLRAFGGVAGLPELWFLFSVLGRRAAAGVQHTPRTQRPVLVNPSPTLHPAPTNRTCQGKTASSCH